MSYFITFEGIEGCGKSTQALLLKEYLLSLDYNVLLTREPGGPPISEKIRRILLDNGNSRMLAETELLLYMASRAQHTGEWIKPALNAGKIVICDRYTDSSLAYQGGGRELDLAMIISIAKFATFGIIPDCTILLDIPVEIALERIKHKDADRIESEDFSFHQKVRDVFIDVAKKEPVRYIIMNGNDKVENIQSRIIETILTKIKDGKKR